MSALDKVVSEKIKMRVVADRYAALRAIKIAVDQRGMFTVAKQYGCLVNNSAEGFAIEFMTAYNNEVSYTY